MSDPIAPEHHDTLPEVPDPSEQPRQIVGHQHAIDFLTTAYRSGRLPHALLFSGPYGIGKATLAFQFARYLFSHLDANTAPAGFGIPDPESSLFRQVASGAHHGLLHLTRPYDDKSKKFKTRLTVDEIRTISHFVSMTSHDGGYRVIIVDSADDMNVNAANALLKNLEEPPARTIFVLISHAPGRLLPTIRSRCQVVRFLPLEPGDLQNVMTFLPDGGVTEDQRQTAIGMCEGSVRRAILLTQFGGLDIRQAIEASLTEKRFNPAEARKISDAVGARGNDVQFDLFNEAIADLLAQNAHSAALNKELSVAAKWSDLWQENQKQIGAVLAYNLDRKQHVMGALSSIHQTTGGLHS